MKAPRNIAEDQGFSLVEVSVVITLLVVVTGAAWNILFSSQRLFEEQVALYNLDSTGWRLMERLTEELRAAEPTSVLPLVMEKSPQISFQRVVGFNGGAAQLGPLMSFVHRPVNGESLNGKDDNGDGRADEGQLLFDDGVNGAQPLASDVLGFTVESTPSGISFTTVVGVVSREGPVMQRTFTREVSFRH